VDVSHELRDFHCQMFVVGYARTTLLLLPTFSDPLNS